MSDFLQADVVIVGAGPVGLFQIFELGLLGIQAHVIDSLGTAGGQCTELYPDKPIYDIPALPVCGAQELIDRLLQQAKPFNAQFHLGQEVTELERLPDGRFRVATAGGLRLIAGAVVIAGGVGANLRLRARLLEVARADGAELYFPRSEFCTDNGAMIALAGCLRLQAGARQGLGVGARAKWELEDNGITEA